MIRSEEEMREIMRRVSRPPPPPPSRRSRADGSRPLPFNRDDLGRMVREAWVRWAQRQPNPKPSWLVPYEELAESYKEADRQIGEAIARWTLIGDVASRCGADEAEDARLTAAIRKCIAHLEDGENHNEGAFDESCDICVLLAELRVLVK